MRPVCSDGIADVGKRIGEGLAAALAERERATVEACARAACYLCRAGEKVYFHEEWQAGHSDGEGGSIDCDAATIWDAFPHLRRDNG